ncbi:MAG: tRNA (adenosine(37)-N6)-dimethylallyltransferase MiaA [Alphaproteobacteria bacterium]
MVERPIIVIAGLTASGKSRAALMLAEKLNGVIINADSMQVYQGLPILTAQPSLDDLRRAPHCLYAIVPPEEISSVGTWRVQALKEIAAAHRQGKLPILVGGTGLYLKALFEGIVDIPSIPTHIRVTVRKRLEKEGITGLHPILAQHDPVMAHRLKPGDTQRIIRALEVVMGTGQSLSVWQQTTKAEVPQERALLISFQPDRETIRAAIAQRLEGMVAEGAVEEVQVLLRRAIPSDRPILRAVGVPEFSAYLRGECSKAEALAQATSASRQYAKRQRTWLRTQMQNFGIAQKTINAQFSESFEPEILSFVRSFH